jgi:iron complex outermembrane recepter protein
VEASLKYGWDGFSFNANYAYVDAVFLNNIVIPSPNNPYSVQDPSSAYYGDIFVHPGNRLPVIPPHRFKAGFDYAVTDNWKVGADAVLASSQYLFGDESNKNPQLPGYGTVNLRTSYRLAENVTVYALVNNLFDHKYATYGTFYETGITNVAGSPSTSLSNPETITPAQPLSVYAGVKVKF